MTKAATKDPGAAAVAEPEAKEEAGGAPKGDVGREDNIAVTDGQVLDMNRRTTDVSLKLDIKRDFYCFDQKNLETGEWGKVYQPLKTGWQKIRLICGISITDGVQSIMDWNGVPYFSYQAKGYRLMADGSKVFGVGTKSLNMDAKKREFRIKATKMQSSKKYPKSKTQTEIWFLEQVTRIENHGPQYVETVAQNRLTASLMGIGTSDSEEANLIVDEIENVRQYKDGEEGVMSKKSAKVVAGMFAEVTKYGYDSNKVLHWAYKKFNVTSITSLPDKDVRRIAAAAKKGEIPDVCKFTKLESGSKAKKPAGKGGK